MPSPTVCTVTGLVADHTSTGIPGVIVIANSVRPFVHPTDGSLIVNYYNSVTTNASGLWTMNLTETATPNIGITLSFLYPQGPNSQSQKYDYTVIVPNTASATFSSLIGTQV